MVPAVVHVVLRESIAADPEQVRSALGRLGRAGLESVDDRRVERLGIASGEVRASGQGLVRVLELLRADPAVESVEVDGLRKIV